MTGLETTYRVIIIKIERVVYVLPRHSEQMREHARGIPGKEQVNYPKKIIY